MTERKVRVRFAPSPTGRCTSAVCVQLYTIISLRQHGGDLIFVLKILIPTGLYRVRKNISWSLSNGWASRLTRA